MPNKGLCSCPDCLDSSKDRYVYRSKQGKSVFTGFLKEGGTGNMIWIGKDEKAKRRVINTSNEKDAQFFLMEMRQYD